MANNIFWKDSPNRPHVTNLPPEIQLSIFDHLDPVTSTCLGLSSKKLYPLHRSTHKKVGLYETSSDHHSLPLAIYLKNWAPSDLVLDWESANWLVGKDIRPFRLAGPENEDIGRGKGWRRIIIIILLEICGSYTLLVKVIIIGIMNRFKGMRGPSRRD